MGEGCWPSRCCTVQLPRLSISPEVWTSSAKETHSNVLPFDGGKSPLISYSLETNTGFQDAVSIPSFVPRVT